MSAKSRSKSRSPPLKPKSCKLCGTTPNSPTELVEESSMQQGWGDCQPWAKGSVGKPVGRFCKICSNAYDTTMQAKYGKIGSYLEAITKDPGLHAQAFLPRRAAWLKRRNANPTGRVKKTLEEAVAIGSASKDELFAPEEEFVTEEALGR